MFKEKFKNKTILIVEDDPLSFKLLFEYLTITDASIQHAKNPSSHYCQICNPHRESSRRSEVDKD